MECNNSPKSLLGLTERHCDLFMKPDLNKAMECPNCHQTMPAGAPEGLCPSCLLAQGEETERAEPRSREPFVPLPIAQVAGLFPQLEILGLLGAGGMGAVYKARQPALERIVALKILPDASAGGVSFVERFNREARALARLNHPNIVAVYEFGQVEGLSFFIMEFVDGANLRQLERAGRLSPREALQIIPQICDALQYAHDEGVVHRDIKPENVLVDRKGRVKIADFGLAKIVGRETESLRLTAEGQVMGTPHYMAPEQLERPLDVDHRADIYSLGVVFYEMLTGDLPLGKFPPPSRKVRVDVRLDEVVLRTLENDPERRYQKAGEVKSHVETIAGRSEPIQSSSLEAPATQGPAGVPQASESTVFLLPERLSRRALAGACWIPLFFVALALSIFTTEEVGNSGLRDQLEPAWWQILLAVTVLLPGFLAPFGTTLLGWLAVGDIRRSRGRVGGLPLAVADGLFFPLLGLDAALYLGLSGAFYWFTAQFLDPSFQNPPRSLVTIGVTLICALLDFMIIRRVWRALRLDRPQPPMAANPGWNIARAGVALAVLCAAVLGAMGYHHSRSGSQRTAANQVGQRDAETGRFVANLPGRGKVELLAIGEPGAALNGWWRPDGSPITNATYEVRRAAEMPMTGHVQKELLFHVSDLPSGASRNGIEVEPASAGASGGEVFCNGKSLTGAWQARFAWEAKRHQATARLAFGLAPWRTIATESLLSQSGMQERLPTDPNWSVHFQRPPYNAPGESQIAVVFGPPARDWTHRVVAVDTNDVEHSYSSSQGTPVGNKTLWTYQWLGLPASKVKEFRLQVRPLHWVEFRDFALSPSRPVPRPVPYRFRPVRECTFSELIDFDTGKTGDFPPGPSDTKNIFDGIAFNVQWMQEQGFDAEANTDALHPVGMDFVALQNPDWENLTANAVMQRFYTGSIYRPRELKPLKDGELPATFAFRTREQNIGLLQLVAFHPERPGATVRFKLVEKPAAELERIDR